MRRYDIAIIGGGILGVAISYYLGFLNPDSAIAVIEREDRVAYHASGRNTGKVHAPYLYDPDKKGILARAAYAGYDMWREYTRTKGVAFHADGVAEVAVTEKDVGELDKHYRWGIRNGLAESDLEIYHDNFNTVEGAITCKGALVCGRDASVNYADLTRHLMADSLSNGVQLLTAERLIDTHTQNDGIRLDMYNGDIIHADFVINAAGGESIDVAHAMGVAEEYTDMHFRGEYWRAPADYNNLTSMSIYAVPRYVDYPFLDPHWIRKPDGTYEVGPNAVPVFSPYGYDMAENAKRALPKLLEMLGSGARHTLSDGQFRRMAAAELWSSLSKHAMINRVRRFLPDIEPGRFMCRGTAGIRSPVIDERGRFLPDITTLEGPHSLHILNYNSPGATGALPFAAHLIHMMHTSGILRCTLDDAQCGPWRFSDVTSKTQ